ncbi:MAG: beta-galactosidase trimerization domain-containing protein [Anaerolineae bacterium]|nr:beta-galactosidase trimerization domain-containing protein [Anaerolineae bacterium]
MESELAYRQIHMDFHTSEAIDGIGADFDPDVFADTLQQAHVNSINLFARGHHGWVYYDTPGYPERRHPHLERDLLREQIEACHARGIRTPVYVTVQWDHYTALRHPEWRVVEPDGSLEGTPPYEAGFYRRLCLNTPYVEWLKGFVAEVIDELPIDGLWLDIVDAQDCSCWYCQQGMRRAGMDPADAGQRAAYGRQVLHRFQREMTAFAHARRPGLLVFYNAGHVGPQHRATIDAFTHLELESLPSGGWGYMHFPIAARYARTLGVEYLGMTGKFQTSWGDFHSFKNRAALEFECFHMLALNAKCCVGDQLHPRGRICPHTYQLVGDVYAQVAAKEPWCTDARAVTEIGVLTPEEFDPALRRGDVDWRPIQGATRMLHEGAHQFDIIDSAADLDRYAVLVLPDRIPVSGAFAAKLAQYLAEGGALVASYASGMDAAQSVFTLDALGVTLTGPGPRDAAGDLVRGRETPGNAYLQYIVPRTPLARGLPQTEHAMYMRGMDIAASEGAEVLADVVATYFDRTYAHFCSHRQAPSSGEVVQPAAVQRGKAIYFSHPLFAQYQSKAPRWCRQLFLNALERLLPEPLVRIQAPTGTIVTLNAQPAAQRWVLHVLYYVPERRCETYDVIENVVPLYDVEVSVRTGCAPSALSLAPQGDAIPFAYREGRVRFKVPRVEGHQMVALSFAEGGA